MGERCDRAGFDCILPQVGLRGDEPSGVEWLVSFTFVFIDTV